MTRDCDSPGTGGGKSGQGDRFAYGFCLVVGLVVLFAHLTGVIQGVIITFIAIGALAVALVVALVWWRVVRPRQLAQRAAIMAAIRGGSAVMPRQYGAQLGAPAPYAGQLPAANPPPVQVVINLTDEQAAQFLGGRGGRDG